MAISPEEAQKLTHSHLMIVYKYEKEIDKLLEESYDGQATIQLRLEQSLPTPRIQRELAKRYQKAGWATLRFEERIEHLDDFCDVILSVGERPTFWAANEVLVRGDQ
jgi:hypothetical protein